MPQSSPARLSPPRALTLTRAASTLALLVAFAGALKLSERLPWRLDLTQDARYTLSEPLIARLNGLSEPVVVSAYLPLSAPPPYRGVARHAADLLREAGRGVGRGLWRVAVIDTAAVMGEGERARLEAEAAEVGVRARALEGREGGRSVSLRVPVGVSLAQGERRERVWLPEREEEVEGALDRALTRLIERAPPRRLGVITGAGEPDILRSPLAAELAEGVELYPLTLDGPSLRGRVDAALLLGPTRPYGERARYLIDQLLCDGGGVVWALDHRAQSEVDPALWVGRPSGFESLMSAYGVEVEGRWVVADEAHAAHAALWRDAQGRPLTARQPLYPRARAGGPLGLSGEVVSPMSPPLRLPSDAEALLTTSASAEALLDLRGLDLSAAQGRRAGPFTLAFTLEREFQSAFKAPPAPPEGVTDPPHLSRGLGVGRVVFFGSGRRLLSADARGLEALKAGVAWALGGEGVRARPLLPPPRVSLTPTTERALPLLAPLTPVAALGLMWLAAWLWRGLRLWSLRVRGGP
jgi:hypothetical protein